GDPRAAQLLERGGHVGGVEPVERARQRRLAAQGAAQLLGAARLVVAAGGGDERHRGDQRGGAGRPPPRGHQAFGSSSSLSARPFAFSATLSILSVCLPPVRSSTTSAALSMPLSICSPRPLARPFSLSMNPIGPSCGGGGGRGSVGSGSLGRQ